MLERFENDGEIEKIWQTVLSIAPTDSDALDIFCQHWSQNDLLRCGYCGSTDLNRAPGDRRCKCDNCGKKVWVTSEKLLERAERFQAYLAAALIREAGLFISGAAFARLTEVQTSTAYNILRKFNIALANQLPQDAEEISGRLMKLIIAKRTCETPARLHPFAEQELIDEEIFQSRSEQDWVASDCAQNKSAEEEQDDFARNTELVLGVLSAEVGMTADDVQLKTGIAIGVVTGSLFVLELNGKARRVPGGKYFLCVVSAADQFQARENSQLAESVRLGAIKYLSVIGEYLHRVGRKGLQHHLAAVWCALDRATWGPGSLISLSGMHPPVPYRQMVEYVSPPYLKIVIC